MALLISRAVQGRVLRPAAVLLRTEHSKLSTVIPSAKIMSSRRMQSPTLENVAVDDVSSAEQASNRASPRKRGVKRAAPAGAVTDAAVAEGSSSSPKIPEKAKSATKKPRKKPAYEPDGSIGDDVVPGLFEISLGKVLCPDARSLHRRKPSQC